MTTTRLAAVDLGAESGRVLVGTLVNGRLSARTVHRFPNRGVQHVDHWRWDTPAIQAGILTGLSKAAGDGPLASVGIDTWGVDGTWVDPVCGHPLLAAVQYRDRRTHGWPERVNAELGDGELFRRTGIAPMVFNTIYQLLAAQRSGAAPHGPARWLFMPDLLHRWLGGAAVNEWTIAGTSGLTVAGKPEWDMALIERLGLPSGWFGPIVPAGTRVGTVCANLWDSLGISSPPPAIVVPGSHDTASAFAAAINAHPAPGTAVVSCGTWSLVGAITATPVCTADAQRRSLSNEIATDGRIRLLTNVMGLWVVQQCRAAFATATAGRDYDYPTLTALAAQAPSPAKTLDVNDARFFAPTTTHDPMPARIVNWYREHGVTAPDSDGAIVRAVLEGLAAAYATTCANLSAVTGSPITALVVVGGGVRNRLLLELAERACGIPVIAGPAEATAVGNLMVQAQGLGLAVTAVDDAE